MLSMRTIASNALLLSTAQILNPLTSIFLVSAIARLQGAEALGQYSLVLTLFYMAVAVAGLGLNTPITRAVSIRKDQACDYLIVVSIIGLIAGLLAIAGVRLIVTVLSYSQEIQASAITISWAIIPAVLISLYEAIFLAFHKAHFIASLSIVENVCKVSIGLILLALEKDILTLFILITCLRSITLVVYLLYFRIAIANITLHINWTIIKELWKVSPIFTGNLLVEALFGRVDILILSKLGTVADVGYYSAALRFVEIAKLVPVSYVRAAFPAMCEILQSNPNASKKLFLRSVSYMIIYGAGICISIFFFSELLITLLYGSNYSESESLLNILAFLIIPAALSPVMATTLFAGHHELLDFYANIIRITILVFLCAVLTPRWGSVGPAVSLIAADSILFICLTLLVRLKMFEFKLLKRFSWPVMAAVLAYAISLLIPKTPLILHGLIIIFSYFLLILLFQPTIRKDLIQISSLLRERLG